MSSKQSKAKRKEDRIQQLERELANTKKELSAQKKTMHFDDEQVNQFLDALTERIEWSTNRIVAETKTQKIIAIEPNSERKDAFSFIIKLVLGMLFVVFGIIMVLFIFSKENVYWNQGWNGKFAVIFIGVIGVDCIVLGIDIFREKNRNYLIALFSALVSLVALVVALVK